MERGEVIVPHDLKRGPVVALRRMLVHSSLTELKNFGLFERYTRVMDPQALQTINELIGPGWMPIALAQAHYHACDQLALPEQQIYEAGMRSGEKTGDQLMVAGAKGGGPIDERTAWTMITAFSRMGRRIYDGGSSQYVRLAGKKLLIEHRGNPLYAIHYYRIAHGGFLFKTFASLGSDLIDFRLSPFRHEGAQIEAYLTWK